MAVWSEGYVGKSGVCYKYNIEYNKYVGCIEDT